MFIHDFCFVDTVTPKTATDGWRCSSIDAKLVTENQSANSVLVERIPILPDKQNNHLPDVRRYILINLEVICELFSVRSRVPSKYIITKIIRYRWQLFQSITELSAHITLPSSLWAGWKGNILGRCFPTPYFWRDSNHKNIL